MTQMKGQIDPKYELLSISSSVINASMLFALVRSLIGSRRTMKATHLIWSEASGAQLFLKQLQNPQQDNLVNLFYILLQ
jgi:hypothetical protein